jgi:transcriptional regulator of nitric oxide reductase
MSNAGSKLLKVTAVLSALAVILNYSYSQDAPPQSLKKERDMAADLRSVLPEAEKFEKKKGPRYYIGYKEGKIIGYVFYTFDLAKDIKGFNGPINLLVGTDMKKRIKNIVLREHKDDSLFIKDILGEYKFLDSFKKNITHRDIEIKGKIEAEKGVKIKIGKNIFAKTGATISATGIAKSIKKSLRIIDDCHKPK